jgi:hypothetical protein
VRQTKTDIRCLSTANFRSGMFCLLEHPSECQESDFYLCFSTYICAFRPKSALVLVHCAKLVLRFGINRDAFCVGAPASSRH